ncbi:hypothetical protein ACWGDS_25990 [Streptomyces sp. NPDC055059]
MGIGVGDWPTWIGAIFAAVAAGATLWTLKSQRDQIGEQRVFIGEQRDFMAEQAANLLLEREELRASIAERRISQAQQISMGVLNVVTDGAPGDEDGEPIADTFLVRMLNGSAEPVHDVTAHFGGTSSVENSKLIFVEIPMRDGRWIPFESVATPMTLIVGSGQRWQFRSEQGARLRNERPHLLFTDNAGVRWQLDEHGDLREVA